MKDQRAWFSEAAGRRVTVTEIADHLGVSRKTGQSRLEAGLGADDIIVVARALHIRPVDALIELGKLTYAEVYDWLDSDGQLLATASEAELAVELVTRLAPDAISSPAVEPTPMMSRKKVLELDGVRHAASRREKEMYPETPDDGM
ncbi:hypothetical protein ERC79_02895 [Rhodococcus sp. ABRD24]|uniref:hypothetical protein n=1 Tax=Rhodococcus sp. ABRD24 TaxID=2507582 RepID=UPI00103951E4|nr:hypothetical protein [Rhodococcus sp. ABRD24]QBJ95027.1 hypothetical protein ERC79_02895 [Rhodococcus sp. ABRD24]